MRLILRNGRENVWGPFGELYAADANAYAHPIWAFHVDHEQELPRVDAGALVAVDTVVRGKDTTINAPGTIVQARRLTQPVTLESILAERGNVLVHPVMYHFVDTWEYVASPSFATVDSRAPKRIERAVDRSRPIVAALPVKPEHGHRARHERGRGATRRQRVDDDATGVDRRRRARTTGGCADMARRRRIPDHHRSRRQRAARVRPA